MTMQSIGALLQTVNEGLRSAGVEQQQRIVNGQAQYRFLVPLRDGRRMSFEASEPLFDVEVGGKVGKKLKTVAKKTAKAATKVAKSKAFGKLIKAAGAISMVVPGGQALGAGLAAASVVQSKLAKAGKGAKAAVKGAKSVVGKKVAQRVQVTARSVPPPRPAAPPMRALPPPRPAAPEPAEQEPEQSYESEPAEEPEQSYESEPEQSDGGYDVESSDEVGAIVSRANSAFAAAGIEQQQRVANGRVYHRFLVPLRDGRRLAFSASEALRGVEIGAKGAKKAPAAKVAKARALNKMVKAGPKVATKTARPAAFKAGVTSAARAKAVAKKKAPAKKAPVRPVKPAAGAALAVRRPAPLARPGAPAKRPAAGAAKPAKAASKGRVILVRTPSGRQARVEFL